MSASLPSSALPLPRADGEATRQRLMEAALALFADKGFAQTSVREIARAASANVAAISYHFGDKAGLYRAVFFEPVNTVEDDLARYRGDQLSLTEALQGYIDACLDPLCMGQAARQCVRLRMREMLEPTGLWQEEIEQGMRPMHDQLVRVICRHLGLAEPDDDIHRLAVAISGLSVYLYIGEEILQSVAPQLLGLGEPLEQWRRFLLRQSLAMVEAERLHRQPPSSHTPTGASHA